MAFGDDWAVGLLNELVEQGPTEAAIFPGLFGVAVERHANAVGAGSGSGERFAEGRNVSHDGQLQFTMDTFDALLPGVAEGPGAMGAIERDDAGSSSGEFGGGFKVRSDAEEAVEVLFLDSDDGESGVTADGGDVFGAIDAKARGAPANGCLGDAPDALGMFESIPGCGLTGDHEFSFNPVDACRDR